ncbi:DinB family protein [Cellulomonas fimi]|uniref:DinB family protein n=1 Tax=Cellulomonas fimi TaxID=1708 RepID=UPI00235A3482|nr:DinB family protein [Cellulomonas fimi]
MTERLDPPLSADELTTLRAFLDFHRQTLLLKTEGLDAAQLARTLAPSAMTLGGLLKHLALVEDSWFGEVLAGRTASEPWASVDWDADRDWEWSSAAADTPGELRTLLQEAIARSDAIVDELGPDPDRHAVRAHRRTGEPISLRWILVHMIEEYARHNGHADLLRESIDGVTGE